VSQPILTFEDMEKLRRASTFTQGHFKSDILSMCYPAEWGVDGMEPALAQLCADAEDAVRKGTNIIILTDRDVAATQIAIPALLATAAVHHHLVRKGLRTRSGLVVETGCRYFASLAYPDPVAVGLRVAHLGRSSVRYELALFGDAAAPAAAQGHFVHVYVERETQRPVAQLPAALRQALEPLLAANPTAKEDP